MAKRISVSAPNAISDFANPTVIVPLGLNSRRCLSVCGNSLYRLLKISRLKVHLSSTQVPRPGLGTFPLPEKFRHMHAPSCPFPLPSHQSLNHCQHIAVVGNIAGCCRACMGASCCHECDPDTTWSNEEYCSWRYQKYWRAGWQYSRRPFWRNDRRISVSLYTYFRVFTCITYFMVDINFAWFFEYV